ncbi:TMEM70 family [Trinorchestia longiramus]|nr:TMEM70 family [Trinorchestia longiramus]
MFYGHNTCSWNLKKQLDTPDTAGSAPQIIMRHSVMSFSRMSLRPLIFRFQGQQFCSSCTSNVKLICNYRPSQIFTQRCLVTSPHLFTLPEPGSAQASPQHDTAKNTVKNCDTAKADDIGGGTWQEIYEGLLSTQVKLIKSFSLGTSIIGVSIQPIVISHLGESMSLLVSFSALIGMFTFVTPALIHWFTRKYVFKLRYDPQKDLYAATTLSFFLREKTIHFKPSDVTIPELPSMFTTFLVKKKPLFVDMETFKDVEHFGRIMGYDKPLNLYVDSNDKKS